MLDTAINPMLDDDDEVTTEVVNPMLEDEEVSVLPQTLEGSRVFVSRSAPSRSLRYSRKHLSR